MVVRYSSIFGKFLLSVIFILFFAAFGQSESLVPGLQEMWKLLSQSVLGQHIWENYYGVTPIELWFSIRLIVAAVLFAVFAGICLAVWRIRIRNRIVNFMIETPSTLLEAIPEPLYVLLTVIGVLFLLEHYGINLPAFPYLDPSWLDTLIPAVALGLPAAFFLSRVLLLQLRDESGAQYVTTAISKGRSQRGAFYVHILANVWPSVIRNLPVVGAIVLSSALFAEFMFGYQGALFYFSIYGLGRESKFSGLPAYEPGVILLLGLLLVAMWLVFRIISEFLLARFPIEIESTPAPFRVRRQLSWIIIGSVMIGAVIVCSIDPHLVTSNRPNTWHVVNWKLVKLAPFPPNHQFLFGTDFLGRDLLARSLQGTIATLFPVILATFAIMIISAMIPAMAANKPNGMLAKVVRSIGEALSGMPVLLILLVAMHHRNLQSPYQELVYFTWLVVIESGRGMFTYQQTYDAWFRFGFVEGATSVGRNRFSIIFTHFRKWFRNFSVEFAFSEFSRLLSLMAMMAVFQVFAVEKLGWPEFAPPHNVMVMISAQNTWFSMIGDAIWNGGFLENAYYLYAPTLLLLLVSVGANLVARGLKGRQ